MQSTTNFDSVLKEFYLDKIPEMVNQKVNLKEHFKKRSGGEVSVDGRRVVYPVHLGRNTGVGAVGEGANLPTAGNQQYQSMIVPFRFNYGRIQITAQAMKQSMTSKGAFRKAVDEEITRAAKDVGREVNRQLWGYGKGVLCMVNGAVSNGTTVAVDNPGGVVGTANGNRFLRVGDIVAFIKSADDSLEAVGTVATVNSNGLSFTLTAAATLTDNDYVVRCSTTGSTSVNDTAFDKEVMGLLGMIDDGTYVSTYFNIARSTYPTLKAYRHAVGGALSLSHIQKAYDAADQLGNGTIKTMWAHHSIRREYLKLLQTFRRYNDSSAKSPDGGFKGAGIESDIEYAEKPMKVDRDAPYGVIFGVDDSFMYRYALTEGEWADDDGKILLRISGQDAYEARFRIFDNYVCDAPNTCFVMSGITLTDSDTVEVIQNI